MPSRKDLQKANIYRLGKVVRSEVKVYRELLSLGKIELGEYTEIIYLISSFSTRKECQAKSEHCYYNIMKLQNELQQELKNFVKAK